MQDRFVAEVRRVRLPKRQDPEYTNKLRSLHAGILGVCALIESFPYTIEPWMPPLTEGSPEILFPLPIVLTFSASVLSPHASDPPPISSTIRKCASEFKKVRDGCFMPPNSSSNLCFDHEQTHQVSVFVPFFTSSITSLLDFQAFFTFSTCSDDAGREP